MIFLALIFGDFAIILIFAVNIIAEKMNYSITEIFTFIGSIGLFLYGIRSVSDGLQTLAGDQLRDIVSHIKENKFFAVISGFVTTALLQSSGATIVAAVSSVNAGLISLSQAIAVVMGANVGTTVTTWIVSIFGFHFDFYIYVLPLVAIGLPLYNSKNRARSSLGELIIGLAILFFSISMMKQFAPHIDLTQSSENIFVYVLLGIILTVLSSASSVSFCIAVAFYLNDSITFELACAFMVGANIGTCINPLIRTLKANAMAKRAALSHLLFNTLGAIWCLSIFGFFSDFIRLESREFSIALFHTLFNIISLIIFIWFTRYFEKVVTWAIDGNNEDKDSFKLQYISSGMIETGEIALSQAKQDAVLYAKETYKMFKLVNTMLGEPNGSAKIETLYEKVHQLEDESDDAEEEIADFLRSISTSISSTDGEQVAFSLFKMVDEMESIADSIEHLAITIKNRNEQRVVFNEELRQYITKMFTLTDSALTHLVSCVEKEEATEVMINKAYNIEDEINNLRNHLRVSTLEQIDKKQITFQQSTLFMELIKECERIGDYVINVISSMQRE